MGNPSKILRDSVLILTFYTCKIKSWFELQLHLWSFKTKTSSAILSEQTKNIKNHSRRVVSKIIQASPWILGGAQRQKSKFITMLQRLKIVQKSHSVRNMKKIFPNDLWKIGKHCQNR